LTDAFLDFYGDTLQTQLSFHSRNGWPSNEQFYPLTCFAPCARRRCCP
jgi:hypothetical protein